MNAYPMLARCAERQLEVDSEMYHYLVTENGIEEWLRPNLLLSSTYNGEFPRLIPILTMKAG